ncbi:MAG: GIY-YIG nuclease family protein [Candidatus Omnitrophica bacterium]|nr:GIY-YIG nuclease family protein [Candidatus Omnitrophota bacterium]
MYYVYILVSLSSPGRFYVGITDNLERRLMQHTHPQKSAYTRQYAPWRLKTYTVFSEKQKAEAFEIYLKSHSGRAFLRKRLI